MSRLFQSRKIVRLLQLLFAVGLLVLLWRLVESEQALKLLRSAEPVWLLAALLALSLQGVLSALRWRLTASQLGVSFSFGRAIREYYLSQLVNQALPGGILGDAGRAVRSRTPAGLLRSSQAVALERFAGQLALFTLMLVALMLTLIIPTGPDWPSWLLLVVGLLVLGLLAFAMLVLLLALNSSGKTDRFLKDLVASSRLAFLPASVLWRQILFSLGTAVCNVAGFVFASRAIGFELSLLVALAVVPMILLAMLLPLTISGWGLREGVAVALFPLIGATATQGLVASVAFGLVCLAAALPGLAFTRSSDSVRLATTKDQKSAA